MANHGAVDLADTHAYKSVIKEKLGGDEGVGRLLENKGQTNFDFWVHRDGTIWISDNGEGGQGVETDLNFFDLFPEFRPAEPVVAAQQRNFDLPGSDDEEAPTTPGTFYYGDDDVQYFVAPDGRSYEVLADPRGNTYYVDAAGQSQWTNP